MIEEQLDRIIELLEILTGSPAIDTEGPEIFPTCLDSGGLTPPIQNPAPPPVAQIVPAPGQPQHHTGTYIAPPPAADIAPPAAQSLPAGPPPELDSTGYPWDARIHAGTKTKVLKTNEWKLARGVDKDLVAQVRAEWDNVTKGVATPPTAPPPAAQALPAGPPTNDEILPAGPPYQPLPQLAKQPELIPVIAAEMGIML